MRRKQAETWDDYRRLRKRFLLGLEFAPPLRPPRETAPQAAPPAVSSVAVVERPAPLVYEASEENLQKLMKPRRGRRRKE